MTADKWIFPLAIFLMCVSLSDEQYYQEYETHTISAPLGSSALLPCNFTKNSSYSVSWEYTDEEDRGLVHLESGGRIKFSHPRSGRVKAFPNEGSEGNYSICIDALEDSDRGLYVCKKGHDFLQVELVLFSNDRPKYMLLLIYIAVGTLALVLLIVICYREYRPIPFSMNINHGKLSILKVELLRQVPMLHLQSQAQCHHYKNSGEEKTTLILFMRTMTKARRASEVTPPETIAVYQEACIMWTGLNPLKAPNSSADYDKQASVDIIMLTKVKSEDNKPWLLRRRIVNEVGVRKKPKKNMNTTTRFTTEAQNGSIFNEERSLHTAAAWTSIWTLIIHFAFCLSEVNQIKILICINI
ncbi:hypothetical protein INR49_015874 [Caranx melampygus]|nr:hypothetical protein INR49_015874 [Caranx melampygus]